MARVVVVVVGVVNIVVVISSSKSTLIIIVFQQNHNHRRTLSQCDDVCRVPTRSLLLVSATALLMLVMMPQPSIHPSSFLLSFRSFRSVPRSFLINQFSRKLQSWVRQRYGEPVSLDVLPHLAVFDVPSLCGATL